MKQIIINALQYKKNSSGIGVMIRELFGLYTNITKSPCSVVLSNDAPDFPSSQSTDVIHCPWKHSQGLKRIFFQTFVLGRLCKDSVLLTTDSKIPLFLPKSCFLMPVITDLAVFRMPEVYQYSRVLLWRFQYKYLCSRADLVLSISEFTKNEIVEVLKIPEEKVRVIPCACSNKLCRVEDTSQIKAKYRLDRPYILFVGNSNPRKNLARLVRAFDLLKAKENIPHQLVIAGEKGWSFDRESTLSGLQFKNEVRFIDFVADEDMPGLYSAADLFVFPTLYEGFGIPILEAQSCGTPVLTSNTSSLPEVAGNGAFYVDPYNTEDIAAGIRRALNDVDARNERVSAGYENVKRFSWKMSAGLLNDIIETEVNI